MLRPRTAAAPEALGTARRVIDSVGASGASRAISLSSVVYVAASLLLCAASALFIRRDVARVEQFVSK